MQPFCRLIMDELNAGCSLVSVVIYSHKGSTPRTAGARLSVGADGRTHGTVGGGRCEAEAVAAAREMLASAPVSSPPALLLGYSLHGVTDMDMICGGELSLLLQRLDPDEATIALYRRAVEAEDAGRAFSLRAYLEPSAEGGAHILRREFLETADPPLPEDAGPRLLPEGEGYVLTEPFAGRGRLFLFGAGHISRALAALADTLEYRAVVLEDREEFLSAERFPQARLLAVPDQRAETLKRALTDMSPGPADAAVILTRGHAHDRDALQAVLDFAFGYVGMIGSRAKRDAVYAQLGEKGVPPQRLAAVRCPVGLSIGAQTPEEIAVSIAAELIAERRKK